RRDARNNVDYPVLNTSECPHGSFGTRTGRDRRGNSPLLSEGDVLEILPVENERRQFCRCIFSGHSQINTVAAWMLNLDLKQNLYEIQRRMGNRRGVSSSNILKRFARCRMPGRIVSRCCSAPPRWLHSHRAASSTMETMSASPGLSRLISLTQTSHSSSATSVWD